MATVRIQIDHAGPLFAKLSGGVDVTVRDRSPGAAFVQAVAAVLPPLRLELAELIRLVRLLRGPSAGRRPGSPGAASRIAPGAALAGPRAAPGPGGSASASDAPEAEALGEAEMAAAA